MLSSTYFTRLFFPLKTGKLELVDALKVAFLTALTKFHHVNHTYPANIIIYRDGVGDSQLDATQKHEVNI